jgi:8-oxo-dGTP diphosphatase
MRTAISLVSIRDNAILLLLKRDVWILPGGKPNPGEADLDCLRRECREEIPYAKISVGRHYGNFEGKTLHQGDMLCSKVFLGTADGNTAPSAEISQSRFFPKDELASIMISDITSKIITQLIEDELF